VIGQNFTFIFNPVPTVWKKPPPREMEIDNDKFKACAVMWRRIACSVAKHEMHDCLVELGIAGTYASLADARGTILHVCVGTDDTSVAFVRAAFDGLLPTLQGRTLIDCVTATARALAYCGMRAGVSALSQIASDWMLDWGHIMSRDSCQSLVWIYRAWYSVDASVSTAEVVSVLVLRGDLTMADHAYDIVGTRQISEALTEREFDALLLRKGGLAPFEVSEIIRIVLERPSDWGFRWFAQLARCRLITRRADLRRVLDCKAGMSVARMIRETGQALSMLTLFDGTVELESALSLLFVVSTMEYWGTSWITWSWIEMLHVSVIYLVASCMDSPLVQIGASSQTVLRVVSTRVQTAGWTRTIPSPIAGRFDDTEGVSQFIMHVTRLDIIMLMQFPDLFCAAFSLSHGTLHRAPVPSEARRLAHMRSHARIEDVVGGLDVADARRVTIALGVAGVLAELPAEVIAHIARYVQVRLTPSWVHVSQSRV
jgi:hypothetical protein